MDESESNLNKIKKKSVYDSVLFSTRAFDIYNVIILAVPKGK